MHDLYILTEQRFPNLHPDDSGMIEALAAKGIRGIPKIWHELTVDGPVDVLVRTPWDYPEHTESFLQLFEKINAKGGRCFNSTDTLKWNIDKRYLLELEKAGAKIVPTKIFSPFTQQQLQDCVQEFQFPLVGAAGRNTFLLKTHADLPKCECLFGTDVIVQPFISSVLTEGEFSYMFFAGEYSHAVQKIGKKGEFRVQDDFGGTVHEYTPRPTEIATVQRYVQLTEREFEYVRVDVVRMDGDLAIMELEAIEPELFFRFSRSAMEQFCGSLLKKF